jgi:type IV pilus assembly protein PilF
MKTAAALCMVLLALNGCASIATGVVTSTIAAAASDSASSSAPPPNQEQSARARARAHTELAAGYFELGNMAIALEEVKEALRADAEYGPAYNVAGLIYAELKDDKLAHENFQRALRIDPQDSDANNNYGRFLCDRKREGEAIKYFLSALSNPLYATPDHSYVNAGLCTRRQGDMSGAEGYFLQALKVRPTHPQALYQLADIAYARGEFERARDYLMRLEKVAAPGPEVLWLGLRVERRLGDHHAEASYAAQLRRSFPNSKEAGALLAGRYE